MNHFFSNVVSNLSIPQYEDPTVDIDHFEEPSPKANENYINHPSIRAIKENNKDNHFTFGNISKSHKK